MKKLLSIFAVVVISTLVLSGCGKTGSGLLGGDSDKASDGTGRLGETISTVFFDFTVNDAYLCNEYNGYTPAEGNEIIVVNVTVKNTHTATIPMNDLDFQMQWGSENEEDFRFPITSNPETGDEVAAVSEEQLPYEYELSVDEERTGTLVYEVPAGNKDFSVSTIDSYDNGEKGDVYFVYFSAKAK